MSTKIDRDLAVDVRPQPKSTGIRSNDAEEARPSGATQNHVQTSRKASHRLISEELSTLNREIFHLNATGEPIPKASAAEIASRIDSLRVKSITIRRGTGRTSGVSSLDDAELLAGKIGRMIGKSPKDAIAASSLTDERVAGLVGDAS